MSTHTLPNAQCPRSGPSRLPVRTGRGGPAVVVVAWGSMLVASALPQILYAETTGHRPPLWLAAAQVAALLGALAAVGRVRRLRALVPTLRWLIGLAAGWHLAIGAVTGTQAWIDWQHSVPWVVRATAFQAMLFVPTLLLIALGPGRAGRRELRLIRGDDEARAGWGVYTAGIRPRWSRLGPIWALFITVGTVIAMVVALGPKLGPLSVLLVSLPAVAVLAATNAFNEEFGFRNVPLALLPGVLGTRHAMLLTGALFGLAHFGGNPPGVSGVLLATFLGVFLAKSMIETGGSKWAYLIHWLQDVVIFSFLTLAWSNL